MFVFSPWCLSFQSHASSSSWIALVVYTSDVLYVMNPLFASEVQKKAPSSSEICSSERDTWDERRGKWLKCMGSASKKARTRSRKHCFILDERIVKELFAQVFLPLGPESISCGCLLLYTNHPQRPCFMTSCTISSLFMKTSRIWLEREEESRDRKHVQTEEDSYSHLCPLLRFLPLSGKKFFLR